MTGCVRLPDVVTDPAFPTLRTVVLDTTDARGLAEFYRELLGYDYRAWRRAATRRGGRPEGPGLARPRRSLRGTAPRVPAGGRSSRARHGRAPPHRSRLHLDLTVPHEQSLAEQHERALRLGAQLLLDRSDDPQERLYVYADPDGHPFCIFVAAG